MYKLRQIIQSPKNCVINNDIYVKNGIVYLTNNGKEYKHEFECWFIKLDDGSWANLQGGIPNYFAEENLNDEIFEEAPSERL